MTLQQYTITLSDLGVYTLKVVAGDEQSAKNIAIETLYESAQPTPGLSITSRATDAVASVDEPQPSRRFKVTATEIHDMEAVIPAEDRSTAILQARRIIGACGPLMDFDLADSRIGDEIKAVEVSR